METAAEQGDAEINYLYKNKSMKPFILLVIVFILSLAATRIFGGAFDYALSGNIAMAAMLLLTSLGHFRFTKGMSMMLPAFIPFKTAMVYFTGLVEIAAAIGLLLPRFRHLTGCWLIVFFVLMLPVNINAAIKKIDYEKGDYTGSGLSYLWFRVTLQVLFIGWVWFFSVKT